MTKLYYWHVFTDICFIPSSRQELGSNFGLNTNNSNKVWLPVKSLQIINFKKKILSWLLDCSNSLHHTPSTTGVPYSPAHTDTPDCPHTMLPPQPILQLYTHWFCFLPLTPSPPSMESQRTTVCLPATQHPSDPCIPDRRETVLSIQILFSLSNYSLVNHRSQ